MSVSSVLRAFCNKNHKKDQNKVVLGENSEVLFIFCCGPSATYNGFKDDGSRACDCVDHGSPILGSVDALCISIFHVDDGFRLRTQKPRPYILILKPKVTS